MATFRLIVTRPNGTPVQGATLRVLNASSLDVTATLLGSVSPLTNAFGIVERAGLGQTVGPITVPIGPLPLGVYTLQVTAPGYTMATVTTPGVFTGIGQFSATLERSASGQGYAMVLGDTEGSLTNFSTPLASNEVVIESPVSGEWELIETKVEASNGSFSLIETQVDPVTQRAVIDIRNRIRFEPVPVLVADNTPAIADTQFSDEVSLSFASITQAGRVDLEYGAVTYSANIYPVGPSCDLSVFTAGDANTRRWITELPEPIVFRGYYFDAMVWLPTISDEPELTYTLTIEYQTAKGVLVGSVVTHELPASAYVQRVRLDADPDPAVSRAVLRVKKENVEQFKPLIVHYRV
ncbi:carboxypeptidase regulatory-like domain-containing protein [Fibrisoma montanum]|uniref:Carboxypeptidase regulatory-like domain-containing protein n=1 Tax=Fibrisoma montanum TaxID=2305895 RepID=A0A418M212_9BACT|nr:carboxypeptidase-like regulatory domain-containing protein [Fibrisoma montanum]RIV19728.1 carboxypeptidase regulatory-like domain-containing protein [Fibrisoma montanum]